MKVLQAVDYKITLLFSVILHVFLFLLFFLHFKPSKPAPTKVQQVVSATVIHEQQLASAKQAPTEAMAQTKPVMEPVLKKSIAQIEQVALKQPVEDLQPIKKIPKPDFTKTQAAKTITDDAQQALALQEPNFDQAKLEKKRAQEKKQKALKEEMRKKTMAAKLAKQKKEDALQSAAKSEADAVLDESKVEVADTDEKQIASQNLAQDLEAKLTSEKEQLKANTADDGTVDKYKQEIIHAISARWLMPELNDKNLSCQLLVRLGPGGVVLSADVIKESGEPNLDRSARNAILKASPLPIPADSDLFDNFKSLRLTFRPQGIISE